MTTAQWFLIPIFRPNKLEAVKAMNALVERGFKSKLLSLRLKAHWNIEEITITGEEGTDPKESMLLLVGMPDWKGSENMYDLEELKAQVYNTDLNNDTINVINWLISEIETLHLDNTYLQQRLKREVEK